MPLLKRVKLHGVEIDIDEYLNGMIIEGHDAKTIAKDLKVSEAVIARKLDGRTKESVTRQLNAAVSGLVYKGAMLGDSKCIDIVVQNKLDWDLGDRSGDAKEFIQITFPKGYIPKQSGALLKKRAAPKKKVKK